MSSGKQHIVAAEDRVSWNQLVAYGLGGLVSIALFNIAPQLISLLGNISLGLDAVLLGAIMLVPRLWDAFSDPVMGYLSDNTRTRWGRRRPYILLGGIATALTFAAIWWLPRGDWIHDVFASEWAYNVFQLSYILAGVLLFFTATTVFEIPHGALGMEMSGDYHERTRLFSAKSFLGNLFAMGTPWMFALAGLEFFRGPEGNEADGMRLVSLLVAALVIPISVWCFFALREPRFIIAKNEPKTSFWSDMRSTVSNRTFLHLVAIIFTLAMGFNFVQIFNYYITIFYVYGGDTRAAGPLLGYNGTVWAVTGLLAVFPLNWISRRLGKNKTLIIAILLMCAAQLSKIVCYNPELPYLILIPTVLLSAGMLMFFTLGASMVGDICDQDELTTGTRNEGSFYSVYWWFIKLGSAFAGFVMGALLVSTDFDERQNVIADDVRASVAVIHANADKWTTDGSDAVTRRALVEQQLKKTSDNAERLRRHLSERIADDPNRAEHTQGLIGHVDSIRRAAESLKEQSASFATSPATLVRETDRLLEEIQLLKQQTPQTLFRLRLVEIGLPLAMSCVSIFMTRRYPLTEARWQAIKDALDQRHAQQAEPSAE
jgi:GPH family glycoside/pentoside/hexuronide:cation symporter